MTNRTPPYDAIIIGAGAAGLMCAATAGKRGKRVALLEHGPEPGAKIKISGGGRCNFTNIGTTSERFWSENPNFARSALHRYRPADFIAMVERHNIAYHEKTLGQLFCDGSAQAIIDMLMSECRDASVDVLTGRTIKSVTKNDFFSVTCDHGVFHAENLVLATGGLSIPKLGATGFAFDIARQFGLGVTALRPGLVPLTLAGDNLAMAQELSGVSFDSDIRIGKKIRFCERSLFTHRGLSGPAILQISSAWQEGAITINLLPGLDAAAFLLDRKQTRPRSELRAILSEFLPQRLAQKIAATEDAQLPPAMGRRLADIPDRTLRDIASRLTAWQVTPSGTEGFAKAEVMRGGINTDDLDARTMAAKTVPKLFFIGEAVDVTGWLGGYNFQWAWASGFCAGGAI